MSRIYVDHASTTPVLPEVAASMQAWLGGEFGNPSSLHHEGRQARQAIDAAREVITHRLGCLFGEFLFFSSGTEAANQAIVGTALQALASGDPRREILLGAAEHHCVLHTQETLELLGFKVRHIPVTPEAQVVPEALEPMLSDEVLLVSVMHANNELGTINPITELAAVAKRYGARFHTDAVQTFGTLETKVDDLGVDLLSVSAHKICGPKGVGGLYVRSGTFLKPLAVGGGQEREMRAGTENVAGIVGFGKATELLVPRSTAARDEAFKVLEGHAIRSVSAQTPCLPGHVHVRFPGVNSEILLIKLDRLGISASSGAACSSGSLEPSHVLLACGFTEPEAKEGLRLTFGRNQTAETGRTVGETVLQAVQEIVAARR